MLEAGNLWSRDSVPLRLVLGQLEARELARAARVCVGWRAAAADAGVWRAALRARLRRAGSHGCGGARAVEAALRAMRAPGSPQRDWRGECVRAEAPWRLERTLDGISGEEVRSAALCACGSRLALGGAGGAVSVWEAADGEWAAARAVARLELGARWAGVARARWAGDCVRLLLAGRLALSERWELCVWQSASGGCGSGVVLRGDVGPGGAACWAGGGRALLALGAPLRAGRGMALSTLWLYAGTQRVRSEHAGVAVPLLHVWNEEATHISEAVVVENVQQTLSDSVQDNDDTELELEEMLVLGLGKSGVGAWRVSARSLPRQDAAARGSLAERVARARRRRLLPELQPEQPQPDEAALRALCTPPAARLALPARLLGLEPAGEGRVAAACAGAGAGGVCVCVLRVRGGALQLLRQVHAPAAPPPAPHYRLAPAAPAAAHFLGTPAGDGGGGVQLWGAGAGAALAPLPHPAPAVALLLPCARPRAPRPHTALVCAGAHLYERCAGSRPLLHDPHTHMALLLRRLRPPHAAPPLARHRTVPAACDAPPLPPCAPCTAPAPPPCRAPAAGELSALRVTCCPPPVAHRPPCAPPLLACSVSCSSRAPPQPDEAAAGESGACGSQQHAVARRLHAARLARRWDYEREAAERARRASVDCAASGYRLGDAREQALANDGRHCWLRCPTPPPPRCGPVPDRRPPPPQPLALLPDSACRPRAASPALDPCAHRPRVIVHIDRSTPSEAPPVAAPPVPAPRCVTQPSNGEGWCANLPAPAPAPRPCRKSTLLEGLQRRRSKVECGARGGPSRQLHAAAALHASDRTPDARDEATTLEKALKQRATLKEAGRGRQTLEMSESGGRLTARLQLELSLDDELLRARTSTPVTCTHAPRDDRCSRDSWLSLAGLRQKLAGMCGATGGRAGVAGGLQSSDAMRKCERAYGAQSPCACPPARPLRHPPRPQSGAVVATDVAAALQPRKPDCPVRQHNVASPQPYSLGGSSTSQKRDSTAFDARDSAVTSSGATEPCKPNSPSSRPDTPAGASTGKARDPAAPKPRDCTAPLSDTQPQMPDARRSSVLSTTRPTQQGCPRGKPCAPLPCPPPPPSCEPPRPAPRSPSSKIK